MILTSRLVRDVHDTIKPREVCRIQDCSEVLLSEDLCSILYLGRIAPNEIRNAAVTPTTSYPFRWGTYHGVDYF